MKTIKMKFILAFCLFTIGFSSSSDAQLKLGPLLGVNFSDVTGDINSDGRLVGFHIGALANITVSTHFKIEPQVIYSTKGAKGKIEDLDLDYLEIPLWLRYQSRNGFNISAGPYAGFLLSAKTGDTSVKDSYNALDIGAGAGIGFISAGGLGLSLSYSVGLTDIGDKQVVLGSPISFDAKNNNIKISLSFLFGGRE